MNATANFLAVDLGASSGRLVNGRWDGERFTIEELHRFANGYVTDNGHLYWDVGRLWAEIKTGLAKYAARHGDSPAAISVDAWGVDFALLDQSGQLLGNPHHYRDPRTDGMPDQVFAKISPDEVYRQTGIQTMQINTLFQLYSMAISNDCRLRSAANLLMIPDLFHYWLSGEKAVEYTEASTTQMFLCEQRKWAKGMLEQLGIPTRMLGPVVTPGTVLADVRSEVLSECGLTTPFPVIAGASHDTASAVAAVPFLDENSAFISSGTWSLMGIEVADPIPTSQALAHNFTNEGGPGGRILLMRNITGLWLLQECVAQWKREGRQYTWDEVVGMAATARPFSCLLDPDAHDFMLGGDMPSAIRNYCERTGQTVPQNDGEIARACLESLSLKYRSVLDALESLIGRRLETVRVVGGGCQNVLLCQFTADACRRPVVAGPTEASALGNVMVQAVATGKLQSLAAGRESIAASTELKAFNPSLSDQWEQAYQNFCALERGTQ